MYFKLNLNQFWLHQVKQLLGVAGLPSWHWEDRAGAYKTLCKVLSMSLHKGDDKCTQKNPSRKIQTSS